MSPLNGSDVPTPMQNVGTVQETSSSTTWPCEDGSASPTGVKAVPSQTCVCCPTARHDVLAVQETALSTPGTLTAGRASGAQPVPSQRAAAAGSGGNVSA